MAKSYKQNCPIARSLDVLGERWTLLIMRELLGGPRRYGDLRAELPGIATNLLAERLKELQEAGLVVRTDLPAPIARTVYDLSETGWQRVWPILQALVLFGVDRLDPIDGAAVSPLNGFLAGILLGLNPAHATTVEASYRIDIDGRRFEFAIKRGELTAAYGEPAVTVSAAARDLVTTRLGKDQGSRDAALQQINFDGRPEDIETMRTTFSIAR